MSNIWTNDRHVPQAEEQRRSSPVVAVLVALLCWAGVFVGMVIVMILAVAGNAESVLESPDAVVSGASAVWFAAAMVLATRVAAGVLRRRGIEQAGWLVALPVAYALLFIVDGGMPDPLWPTMLQAALSIAGSIAAVTLWSPAPVRRRT